MSPFRKQMMLHQLEGAADLIDFLRRKLLIGRIADKDVLLALSKIKGMIESQENRLKAEENFSTDSHRGG